MMDIVTDAVPDSYYKREEDPALYVSSKTGRGPLSRTWCNEYREARFGKCASGTGTAAVFNRSVSSNSSPSPSRSKPKKSASTSSSPSLSRSVSANTPSELAATASSASPSATASEPVPAAAPAVPAPVSDSGLESNTASVESGSTVSGSASGSAVDVGSREKYTRKQFMCSYKVIRINLGVWGLQTRCEAWTDSGTPRPLQLPL